MKPASSVNLIYLSDGVTSPEVQLWAAVMQLAILDAAPYARKEEEYTYEQVRHGRQALNWIMSEHCMVGSFRWVCDLLKLDRIEIRDRIGVDRSKTW